MEDPTTQPEEPVVEGADAPKEAMTTTDALEPEEDNTLEPGEDNAPEPQDPDGPEPWKPALTFSEMEEKLNWIWKRDRKAMNRKSIKLFDSVRMCIKEIVEKEREMAMLE